MRFFLAGLFLILLPSLTLAQATGQVESIGFNRYYRPECWTPMVVSLSPTTSETQKFLLQVTQSDLDHDQVIFSKLISLTGNVEGQPRRTDKFEMYFIPEPVNGGLPNTRQSGATIKHLQQRLKVRLASESGKPLVNIPIPSNESDMVSTVDPPGGGQGFSDANKGCKLILCVRDNSTPLWSEYQNDRTMGLLEDVMFVSVRPADLPENTLGYDAVDAILWLDSPALDPSRPVEEMKMRVLQQYVRQGGKLVIAQPAEWQKTLPFGELLPVQLEGVTDSDNLDVLARLAMARGSSQLHKLDNKTPMTYKVALATAKPGALVEEWIKPGGPDDKDSPYLVRGAYGLGSVTWVAQDLGSRPIVQSLSSGWPFVWDRVFDWQNDPRIDLAPNDLTRSVYQPASNGIDFGMSMLHMDLTGKSAGYIGIAVLFFIAYWGIAGLGSHLFLMARKKAGMSWFVFAASAIIATGLTILIVELVLSGPPEMKHVTVVRMTAGQPAVVDTRMGLYIPEDGERKISLAGNAAGATSYVTAFAIHPQHLSSEGESFTGEYRVPLHDSTSTDEVAIGVPYRSTLKKLQAHWVGNLDIAVEGKPTLSSDGKIIVEGTLTNRTKEDLRNVYVAFKYPYGQSFVDYVAFIPSWPIDAAIDLKKEFDQKNILTETGTMPEQGGHRFGRAKTEWLEYWYRPYRNLMNADTAGDDFEHAVPKAVPLLSFFDRLAPARNRGAQRSERFELIRRGARDMDISQAISCGELVVVAQSAVDAPLPIPVKVEDKLTPGLGVTIYQFVLPLDRGDVDAKARLEATEEPPKVETMVEPNKVEQKVGPKVVPRKKNR